MTICVHFFLGLQPNCPLIASTSIQQGAVLKMFICRDTIMKNVTLMVIFRILCFFFFYLNEVS